MPATLHLDQRYLRLLVDLFEKHLCDQPVEVLAYGSRLTDNFHSGSDLDLVVRNYHDRRQPGKNLLNLIEDIRDSNIPILIDILDWARIPAEFHTVIDRQHVVIWQSVAPTSQASSQNNIVKT